MHLNTNIYNGGGCPCSSDDSERRCVCCCRGATGATGSTGPKGSTGHDGLTPTLKIGTVTICAPGESPDASITGTAPNFVLNLTLPGISTDS